MARDARGAEQMERHDMASMLIKLFNAWHRGESLGRRWMPTVTEDFAVIDAAMPHADAAE